MGKDDVNKSKLYCKMCMKHIDKSHFYQSSIEKNQKLCKHHLLFISKKNKRVYPKNPHNESFKMLKKFEKNKFGNISIKNCISKYDIENLVSTVWFWDDLFFINYKSNNYSLKCIRWDPDLPLSCTNIVFLSKKDADEHFENIDTSKDLKEYYSKECIKHFNLRISLLKLKYQV